MTATQYPLFPGITGPSEWLGAPGLRVTWSVRLEGVHTWPGRFGMTHCYRFCDSDGNAIVWKSCRGCANLGAAGQHVVLTGTVKAHNIWKGIRETVLTRCVVKVVEYT